MLFYLLFSQLHSAQGSSAATRLQLTHVGPCDGPQDAIVSFSELGITTHTYDSLLSGEVNITEDVANGWTVKATMQKCQDIRNVDTCDYLTSLHMVRDGCGDSDEAEQELYSVLFHYIEPEIGCPIQAGVYHLSHYPFFTEVNYLTVYETKISTSVFGYTFKLEGYTVNRRKLICLEAYLQLVYMREHDWLASKNKTQTTPPQVLEE